MSDLRRRLGGAQSRCASRCGWVPTTSRSMMSGGVASPYDLLDSLQFSSDEVRTAVEEAAAFGRYVCAHAYTPEAPSRGGGAGNAACAPSSTATLIDELAAADGGEQDAPHRQPRRSLRDEGARRPSSA